jgi:hypothetical protein
MRESFLYKWNDIIWLYIVVMIAIIVVEIIKLMIMVFEGSWNISFDASLVI